MNCGQTVTLTEALETAPPQGRWMEKNLKVLEFSPATHLAFPLFEYDIFKRGYAVLCLSSCSPREQPLTPKKHHSSVDISAYLTAALIWEPLLEHQASTWLLDHQASCSSSYVVTMKWLTQSGHYQLLFPIWAGDTLANSSQRNAAKFQLQ